jgi:hypothetical protein
MTIEPHPRCEFGSNGFLLTFMKRRKSKVCFFHQNQMIVCVCDSGKFAVAGLSAPRLRFYQKGHNLYMLTLAKSDQLCAVLPFEPNDRVFPILEPV